MLGVSYQIQEDLLKLVRVGDGLGQIAVQVSFYFDVVYLQIVVSELDSSFENLVDVRYDPFGLLLARKGQQVLNYFLAAQGETVDFEEAVLCALIQVFSQLEKLRVAHDSGQRIVKLVSDPGYQLADGGQFL